MPLPKENTYTTDYIYSLPEGQRAELIDGVIYDMHHQTDCIRKSSRLLHGALRHIFAKITVPVKSILPHLPFF